jgi:hypothetical protein
MKCATGLCNTDAIISLLFKLVTITVMLGRSRLFKNLAAGCARQGEVQKQYIDHVSWPSNQIQRRRSISCLDDRISTPSQKFRNRLPQWVYIFHNQDNYLTRRWGWEGAIVLSVG